MEQEMRPSNQRENIRSFDVAIILNRFSNYDEEIESILTISYTYS